MVRITTNASHSPRINFLYTKDENAEQKQTRVCLQYPIRRLETEVKEQDEAPDAALSLQPHRRRAGACSRSCGWLDEAQRLGELAHGETSFLQETHSNL
ncbi:hypothetical protein RvY_08506-2 [Ramazzottius varieornatus]|uniref:Uncharacterized protein n=1 Tax=Ramazzottius varieornatus TaxID=947166 RepID=A0A1D1V8P5_RAMVA|nr:hypothetical protein RvY_08506-2 [Ramazzottius varieornatus]